MSDIKVRKAPVVKKKAVLAPTEKEIETSILEFLNYIQGCKAWKNETVGIYDPTGKFFRKLSGRFSGKGSSDILACVKGRFVAIEVKRNSKAPRSPEQIAFIDDILRVGGVAFFASSIDEVSEKFKEHGLI